MGEIDPYAVCYCRGALGLPAASYAFLSTTPVVPAGITLAVKPQRDGSEADVAPLHRHN
jgi:hypothetical protein